MDCSFGTAAGPMVLPPSGFGIGQSTAVVAFVDCIAYPASVAAE